MYNCIGLLGGLGVGAAVHYYEALAKEHDKRGRTMRLLMVHAEAKRILAFAGAGQSLEMAEYLAGMIGQLKAGGADCAVLPAVTPHYCIRDLLRISPLPLIDLLEAARRATADRRVALFGSRYSMESNLFGAVPAVRPLPDEVTEIDRTYVRIALSGVATAQDHARLTEIAGTLMAREKLDAIVFAGTDLAMLFDAGNTTFPYVDCAALHIDAIMSAVS